MRVIKSTLSSPSITLTPACMSGCVEFMRWRVIPSPTCIWSVKWPVCSSCSCGCWTATPLQQRSQRRVLGLRGLSALRLFTLHHPELPEPWNSSTPTALTQELSRKSKQGHFLQPSKSPPSIFVFLFLILSVFIFRTHPLNHHLSRLTEGWKITLSANRFQVLIEHFADTVALRHTCLLFCKWGRHQRHLSSKRCHSREPRSRLLHIQGVLSLPDQGSVHHAVKHWKRCRWMWCMWFSMFSTAEPHWRSLPPSLFSTESAHNVFFFFYPSSSSLQPCRVKAEQRSFDVSSVLTSPNRLTDGERVIRWKTHTKGGWPVFSVKAVTMHLSDSINCTSWVMHGEVFQ